MNVEKINLKPTDVMIVSFPSHLSRYAVDTFKSRFAAQSGHASEQIIVIDGANEFSLVVIGRD